MPHSPAPMVLEPGFREAVSARTATLPMRPIVASLAPLAVPGADAGAGPGTSCASVAPDRGAAASAAAAPDRGTATSSTAAAPERGTAVSSASVPASSSTAAAPERGTAVGSTAVPDRSTNAVAGAGAAQDKVASGAGGASAGEGPDHAAQDSAPVSDHFSEKLPHETALADSYDKLGPPIGEGTYGTVWRARCRRSGQTVAMKRVILRNEREGFPVSAVREVRALHRLHHPNVVSLLDVVAAPPAAGSSGPGDCYLIFEYAPSDLTGLLAYRKQKLKPPEIKCLIRQLANALDFCHLRNIMHRDLKPSNVLITAKGDLKLCDFGLSRSFTGPGNYSTRVITLWYRPPELLLGTKHYDQRVDVWSAGCIFGELLAGHALFPESSEIKVFQKICERCSATAEEAWPEELRRLPQWDKFGPRKQSEDCANGAPGGSDIFSECLAKHGPTAVDLLRSTLQLDPTNRISAQAVLEHNFFVQEPLPCQPADIKVNQHLSCHELDVKRHREKLREEKEAQRQNKRPQPGQRGDQVGHQAGNPAAQPAGSPAAKRLRPP
uniref:Cyclin-dependent kinase 2 homolog n=1 Tax=Alexandrium monilatum TaxID=311494 RepID=A0A7S4Q8K1_9DINO|mmetsp:Transcript_71295/g.212653  ORF Transcript_71295/g.212653 Transcript_71295/m.212653 type:complete len:552 (-) Transcript_71295:360-2015(-)